MQAKNERVTLRNDPQGSWYRWYELGVGVGNSGGAGLGFRWRRRRSEEPAAPGDSASTKAVATNLR